MCGERAAGLIVNPLTAIFILRMMEENSAFLLTAAMSSLSKILINLSLKQGKRPIGIVRKDSQIQELKDLGLQVVLNSEREDFDQQLTKISESEKPKFAIDFIGSTMTNILLKSIQPEGTVLIVGNLTAKKSENIDLVNIILEDKKISGFHLNSHLTNDNRDWENILRQNYEFFLPKVASVHDWNNFSQAINEYKIEMSKGKVALKIE